MYLPDGKPYGPIRYEEIMRECYYISKFTNTSYNDTLDITPSERAMILRFIEQDAKRKADNEERIAEEVKAKMKK